MNNKEFVSSTIDLLMDKFGDGVVFEVFVEAWEPLESVRDAIDKKIDERDYKKRRNKVRYGRRNMVLDVDDYKCQYCGDVYDADQLEVDHLVPLEKGGTDEFENMATSCSSCNKKKGTTLTEDLTVEELEQRRRDFIGTGVFKGATYDDFKREYEKDGKVTGRAKFERA